MKYMESLCILTSNSLLILQQLMMSDDDDTEIDILVGWCNYEEHVEALAHADQEAGVHEDQGAGG